MERVKGLRGGIILNVELRISDWGDETVLSRRIRDDAPYLGLSEEA